MRTLIFFLVAVLFFFITISNNILPSEEYWRVYNTDNSSIRSNRIQCLNIDKNGKIWVGTDNNININKL
ncbi:MAG: two-component regulator propeller domain-containing protein [bacterium]